MSWHYAAVVRKTKAGDTWSVHEVYDLEDGKRAWTESAMNPYGESHADMLYDLAMMTKDALRHCYRIVGSKLIPCDTKGKIIKETNELQTERPPREKQEERDG